MAELGRDVRAKVEADVRVFVAEKRWEGAAGFEVTDEVRVTIAAHACRLVIGLNIDALRRARTIIVYPDTYIARGQERGPAGIVTERHTPRLGEAWHRGPVVLSWTNVLAGARDERDGRNVVLHEFAHVLDALDDVYDGTPPLDSAEHYRSWRSVMTREFKRLRASAAAGRVDILDRYGATNPAEFFACATEAFFERGGALRSEHPELYEMLRCFFRQEPGGAGVGG